MNNPETLNFPNGGQQNERLTKLYLERDQVKAALNRFASFIEKFSEDKIESLELLLKNAEISL